MLERLLKGKKIVGVVCNQFGDTGKGKIVDYLSEWADVIARGTGGNNAGHTTVVNGVERISHLIPVGIVYDSMGKYNILGNGMVIDTKVLSGEMDDLDRDGLTYNNLMISKDASVIMPYHIKQDRERNQSQEKGGIGSTGRGIGPCYTDKIARRGIFIEDLFNKDVIARKIEGLRKFKVYPEEDLDTEKIINDLAPYTERIAPFVKDTINEMHNFVRRGKKILLEGAQGLLLSIEYGTYPCVTSSDCSLNGTASGVGISANMVDLPLGIIKYPFMTRVGKGSFVTEFGGADSEAYCAKEGDIYYEVNTYLGAKFNLNEIKKLQVEKDFVGLKKFRQSANDCIKANRDKIINMINSEDEFLQGVGVRLIGWEFGATTGRPRRTGWTDAVAARYAVPINGPLMILTKADCLSGVDSFNVCYGYNTSKFTSREFNRSDDYLRSVKPVYRTYDGYGDISDVKDFDKLPQSLKKSISEFEKFTGGCVKVVSVGAEREQTIVR